MSTHRMNLLNSSVRPFDGNCFFSPMSTEVSTTQDPIVLHMITSVVSYIIGVIRIPENYVGTPVVSVFWTSTTTTNTVDFDFRHRTIGAGESAIIATSPSELTADGTVNNGGPATANFLVLDTLPLTTTDITAGQLMYFEFERDGVTDDKVDTITIHGLHFEYDDA